VEIDPSATARPYGKADMLSGMSALSIAVGPGAANSVPRPSARENAHARHRPLPAGVGARRAVVRRTGGTERAGEEGRHLAGPPAGGEVAVLAVRRGPDRLRPRAGADVAPPGYVPVPDAPARSGSAGDLPGPRRGAGGGAVGGGPQPFHAAVRALPHYGAHERGGGQGPSPGAPGVDEGLFFILADRQPSEPLGALPPNPRSLSRYGQRQVRVRCDVRRRGYRCAGDRPERRGMAIRQGRPWLPGVGLSTCRWPQGDKLRGLGRSPSDPPK